MRQLSVNLSIVNDNILEDSEMFSASLTIEPADRARLGNRVRVSPDVAIVTIQDNDGMPLITELIFANCMLSEMHFSIFSLQRSQWVMLIHL